MRKFVYATALSLIGLTIVLLWMAMIGGGGGSSFTMTDALQLGAVGIAPLAFIAFLARPRRA